jgi:hypothetical protein
MKKKPGVLTKPKGLTVAPGQALGYGLQYTHLTSLLLDAEEGMSCSFEFLDDVAEHGTKGKVRLHQTKSTLKKKNPVSDKSTELWKAISNWVNGVKSGVFDPKLTHFILYVSKKVNGPIIDAIAAADTRDQAKEALTLAKDTLWGPAPKYSLRADLSQALAKYANAVFQADECHILPVLQRIRLECGSGSPLEDLKAKIKRMPVSSQHVDDIVHQLCGWVKVQVDHLLERKEPAILSRDQFFMEFTSFVRKIDREQILRNYALEPSEKDAQSHLPRTYVRQLELIDLGFDDKLEAISDYLKASYNRTKWAQRGDVHSSSFEELDLNLRRSWRNLKCRVEAAYKAQNQVDQGKILYSDCMQHKNLVEGMEAPDHFIPGCFHRLSDEQHIGWHPNYRNMLRTKKTA